MNPVDQTKFGKPEGNCFEAAVASILECKIEDLPNLCEAEANGENWLLIMNQGLESRGVAIVHVDMTGTPVPNVYIPPAVHYIVSGMSPRGLLHSTVWRDGQMAHDPHPDRTGIQDIRSIELIVSL